MSRRSDVRKLAAYLALREHESLARFERERRKRLNKPPLMDPKKQARQSSNAETAPASPAGLSSHSKHYIR